MQRVVNWPWWAWTSAWVHTTATGQCQTAGLHTDTCGLCMGFSLWDKQEKIVNKCSSTQLCTSSVISVSVKMVYVTKMHLKRCFLCLIWWKAEEIKLSRWEALGHSPMQHLWQPFVSGILVVKANLLRRENSRAVVTAVLKELMTSRMREVGQCFSFSSTTVYICHDGTERGTKTLHSRSVAKCFRSERQSYCLITEVTGVWLKRAVREALCETGVAAKGLMISPG